MSEQTIWEYVQDILDDETLARLNYAKAQANAAYQHAVNENTKLRAELAAIKPDWESAPEWANDFVLRSYWYGNTQLQDIAEILEHRPEES